jgi:hypothetical protein
MLRCRVVIPSAAASRNSLCRGSAICAFSSLACGLLLFANCGGSPPTKAMAVVPPTPTPTPVEAPSAPRQISPPDGALSPWNPSDYSVTFEWEAVADPSVVWYYVDVRLRYWADLIPGYYLHYWTPLSAVEDSKHKYLGSCRGDVTATSCTTTGWPSGIEIGGPPAQWYAIDCVQWCVEAHRADGTWSTCNSWTFGQCGS